MPTSGGSTNAAVAERLGAALGGGYRLERELGGGGMSRVFVATDERLDRRVVVKVLPPERASVVSAARFEREISVTALLQHPHILPILSAGGSEGLVWFVTPYVAGESLHDRLAGGGRVPPLEALRLLREVADALAYAHGRGVVHRDVKPGNVLLTQGHALLADFGVAHALAGADERIGPSGVSLGTPQYMAPEHLAGERTPDPQSDVYALGVVAYEMLAGQLPFAGDSMREILAAKLRGTPPRLQSVRPDTPRVVSDLVARAIARDPAQRFPDAASFRDAVDAALAALTTRSLRPRRARAWLLAGAAAALVVAAAGALLVRARAGPKLDANRIAVAPFEVLGGGPDLAFWREGLMDLLAANLDGAGALRTVSPTLVVHRWRGRADPQSVATLGRATGAGLAILGRLVGAGPDSVRVTLRLLDVASGDTRAELERQDAVEHIDRLGDSLTIGVLREIGQFRPVGAVRRESIKVSGLPALKAFLQGEQRFRRTEWDSARAAYGRAVALDSNFALALARIGRTYSWQRYGQDSLARVYALRAGANNHGLAPRESLLILADSLRAVVYAYQRDTAYFDHVRRLFATLDEATRRYPQDAEAWYALGDAQFHFGVGAGLAVPPARILEAFEQSIHLDSTFALAYIHPVELALASSDPSRGLRYARTYRPLAPTDVSAAGTALGMRLVAPTPRDAEAVRAVLDTASADVLFNAYSAARQVEDTGEVAIVVLRRMAEGRRALYGAFDPAFARGRLVYQLSFRGHLTEAAALTEARGAPTFATLALLGAVPEAEARSVLAGWLATRARDHLFGTPLADAALPWWLARRDTTALARAAIAPVDAAPSERFVAASALAHLALARGDSASAAARFAALPDPACPLCAATSLTRARLLAARGDLRGARELLSRRVSLLPSALDVVMTLERARVLTRLGDARGAADAYAYVVRAWARGDSSLGPLVAEARRGAQRMPAAAGGTAAPR